MPRITGPDIATHVAQQEAKVVEAAVELFAERGFAEVTLGDVAKAVGLARTSLYRYFPDKDHILLAWLRTEIDHLVEQSEAIAAGDGPPADRLAAWLRLQLGYVADPQHQLFTTIAATIGNLGPSVRAQVADQHRRLYATVEAIVTDALAPAAGPDDMPPRPAEATTRRDPEVVAALVLGMFRAAGDAVGRGGDRGRIGAELERSALAVVTGAAAEPPHG